MRGRQANSPFSISWLGWKDIAKRVKRELEQKQITAVAGGIAFSGMLALFPALIALISLWGYFADPVALQRQLAGLLGVLPPAARQLLAQQLQHIASTSNGALGLGAVVGIVAALWSTSSGVAALIGGVNAAYDEKETRSFFKLRKLSFAFTFTFIGFALLAFGVVALLPLGIEAAGLSEYRSVIELIRWPLLGALALTGLGSIYRHAPDRRPPKVKWVSIGAAVAVVLWLFASFVFSLYARHLGSFNETYGALGGVFALMLWLYASSLVILLGAELNAEIEAQTARDTTIGPDRPMGQRGAVKADTIGDSM